MEMDFRVAKLLEGVGLAVKHDGSDSVEPRRSCLTFSVLHDYPDSVMETKDAIHRAVGKSGNRMIYSLLALNLTQGDIGVCSIIKAKVVERLVAMGDDWPTTELTKRAYDLCLMAAGEYRTNEDQRLIAYLVAHDIVGCGPFSILMEDAANLEEIEINSPQSAIIVYHVKYGRCTTNLKFNSERDFRYAINRLISATQKELNSTFPVVDAQLIDGSRVHAQLKPYSTNGAIASIRLIGGKRVGLKRLMELKAVSPETLAYLWMAVEARLNIIISGAPASGKTTLLLAMHSFVPQSQRVVTIEEDINELRFFGNMEHIVSLQGSSRKGEVSLRDQVVNALHLRPERLIVGEVRGEETKEVFSGSNLGVPFMTTMHSASNGEALLNRLKSRPMSVEHASLSTLDMSAYMRQDAASNRYLESIIEYAWHSRAEVELEMLSGNTDGYTELEVVKNGTLNKEALKDSKVVREFARLNLMSVPSALKEHKKRTAYLSGLSGNEVGDANNYIGNYWEVK